MLQIGTRSGQDHFAIQTARLPNNTQPALGCHRQVNNTDYRTPIDGKGDQGSIDRHTSDEGGGSVDRIENPSIFSAYPAWLILLADNTVIGIRLDDLSAQSCFNCAV